jgi:putative ABC transport system permease protein
MSAAVVTMPPHTDDSVSLARATLLYEWKRFLPALLAVAFAGMLVLVQLGLLLGMFGTVSVVVDGSRADLWVGSPGTPSFDLGRGIALRHESALHMHRDAMQIEPLIVGYADWRGPHGTPVTALVVGVDVHERSLGTPETFPSTLRQALQEPDAIVVDKIDIDKLGAQLGDIGEINGKRAKIVGLTSGFRNIGGAHIFCSVSTARRMLGMEPDFATYLLVKLRQPARAVDVRDDLQPRGERPLFTVWTAREFSTRSQTYWLTESGAGASFGFSSLLGLAVGIVITSQTLIAAVLSSLREYATLRALGVSRRALAFVVLEQSLWIGLLGLTVAGLVTFLAWLLAVTHDIDMVLPWWGVTATAIVTLAVALGSGLFALRTLYRLEPAELLR